MINVSMTLSQAALIIDVLEASEYAKFEHVKGAIIRLKDSIEKPL